jgi:protein-S-isoprenylcysteine O-methyltransferase Ste14
MRILPTIVNLAKKEHTPRARLAAMALESVFFVIIIPVLIASSASAPLASLLSPGRLIRTLIGSVISILGLGLALWTVREQFTKGRGTPVPVMATQKLLRDGPYSLCRNPMVLGTVVFYFGIASSVGGIVPLVIVAGILTFLIAWIKFVEEKEMAARFGDEYRDYKMSAPFIIPRLPRKRKSPTSRQSAASTVVAPPAGQESGSRSRGSTVTLST